MTIIITIVTMSTSKKMTSSVPLGQEEASWDLFGIKTVVVSKSVEGDKTSDAPILEVVV